MSASRIPCKSCRPPPPRRPCPCCLSTLAASSSALSASKWTWFAACTSSLTLRLASRSLWRSPSAWPSRSPASGARPRDTGSIQRECLRRRSSMGLRAASETRLGLPEGGSPGPPCSGGLGGCWRGPWRSGRPRRSARPSPCTESGRSERPCGARGANPAGRCDGSDGRLSSSLGGTTGKYAKVFLAEVLAAPARSPPLSASISLLA
mmetsp:Transcript_67885/g.214765  ORF Transcript_67885/g.214765 Transcript_67885/m.214765 type:complete len:207 (+) Transcript_67885:923-1543(+)